MPLLSRRSFSLVEGISGTHGRIRISIQRLLASNTSQNEDGEHLLQSHCELTRVQCHQLRDSITINEDEVVKQGKNIYKATVPLLSMSPQSPHPCLLCLYQQIVTAECPASSNFQLPRMTQEYLSLLSNYIQSNCGMYFFGLFFFLVFFSFLSLKYACSRLL